MGPPHRIDDLVILGRAAPEPIDDGRHTVCLGGYSETIGYVRLYPTQERMQELKRWNVVSVPVEDAAPEDTREESYKIAGSKEDWDTLHRKIDKVGRLSKTEQIQMVERLAGDCTKRLNAEKRSLGIAKPSSITDFYIEERDDPTTQMRLDGKKQKGKTQYPYKLYIEYECENCDTQSGHKQHCIEWGVYQYFDNYADPEGVIDALGLRDENRQHYFFIGNLNHQRRAYIIISDLRFTSEQMRTAGFRDDQQAGLGRF